MNIALWIVQIVLAVLFLMAGLLKSTRPRSELVTTLPWVEDFSDRTIKVIGAMEILGAVGLVLPALTGVAPLLTPAAATGLALVMVLAALTHARRREPPAIAINAVLFVPAVLVAWGRFGSWSF